MTEQKTTAEPTLPNVERSVASDEALSAQEGAPAHAARPLSAEGAARVDRPADPANTRHDVESRPLPDDALVILPVRNVVMFPGAVYPLTVGRERSQAAVQEAVRLERPLGVLLQSKPEIETPSPEDLHWVGTSANVLRY